MRRKIRQYLPALLWYVERRLEGERGFLVAVRTRDICGVDRRCGMAVHWLMMRLAERGLARRFKKGTYIVFLRSRSQVAMDSPPATNLFFMSQYCVASPLWTR
jgi:predicted transcriptional regulator of viral defense system